MSNVVRALRRMKTIPARKKNRMLASKYMAFVAAIVAEEQIPIEEAEKKAMAYLLEKEREAGLL